MLGVRRSREDGTADIVPGSDARRPAALVAAVDEAGVDRSLIRAALDLGVAERLDLADAYAQEIEELRARIKPALVR